ncbi:SDR family oxidoreductase [Streptomyces sp. NPDC050264]|uniref:SDR family oxidoreductase n=1 Tax=Streptomyces sp. NPDC050264 TaxID=3155038 RepID=UPI00342DE367
MAAGHHTRTKHAPDTPDTAVLLEHHRAGDGACFSSGRHTLSATGIRTRVDADEGTRDAAGIAGRVATTLRQYTGAGRPLVVGALPLRTDSPCAPHLPAAATWDPAAPLTRAPPPPAPRPFKVVAEHPPEEYMRAMRKVLARMAAGGLDKVVLARSALLSAEAPLEARRLLRNLLTADPHAGRLQPRTAGVPPGPHRGRHPCRGRGPRRPAAGGSGRPAAPVRAGHGHRGRGRRHRPRRRATDGRRRRTGRRPPVDFLVHCAAVLLPGSVHDTTDEDWARAFAVDTTGVFLVSRAVPASMRRRRGGAVVTVTSNAAHRARTRLAAYAASKAAATAFTRCLGLGLAPYGIRCNTVAPGSTDTGMPARLWGDQARHTAVSGLPGQFRPGIPPGTVARPADIAAAVAFLLSDRAAHITLHSPTVDGGATLGT